MKTSKQRPMHEHDLDLIAAHADGSASDPALAAKLVATCDTCRAEYQSHLAVLELLRATPPIAMTAAEKNQLERELRTALTAPGRASATGSTPWWYRLGYGAVAAVVLVVIGYAALPRGGEDGAATGDAADQAMTTMEATGEAPESAFAEDDRSDDVDLEMLLDEFLASPPPSSRILTDEMRERADDCLQTAGVELDSILYTESVEIGDESYVLAASGAADDPQGHVVDAITCETLYSKVKPAGQTPD